MGRAPARANNGAFGRGGEAGAVGGVLPPNAWQIASALGDHIRLAGSSEPKQTIATGDDSSRGGGCGEAFGAAVLGKGFRPITPVIDLLARGWRMAMTGADASSCRAKHAPKYAGVACDDRHDKPPRSARASILRWRSRANTLHRLAATITDMRCTPMRARHAAPLPLIFGARREADTIARVTPPIRRQIATPERDQPLIGIIAKPERAVPARDRGRAVAGGFGDTLATRVDGEGLRPEAGIVGVLARRRRVAAAASDIPAKRMPEPAVLATDDGRLRGIGRGHQSGLRLVAAAFPRSIVISKETFWPSFKPWRPA